MEIPCFRRLWNDRFIYLDWRTEKMLKDLNKISIACIKSENIESGVCHGQFQIKYLGLQQGLTTGNLLRRVLLGDLGCISISAVRIAGVSQEYTNAPGVREDILELLLNLKKIAFKSDTKYVQPGRLKVRGPAVITADSIDLPPNLKIVNPNQYIATISTSNTLEIELKFEYGVGYRLGDPCSFVERDAYLQLDTVFMPVTRVNYNVEPVCDKDGQMGEELVLDIWTNGSISPSKALDSALQVVIDLLTALRDVNNRDKVVIQDLKPRPDIVESYNNKAIEELQLSVRAYNCLKKAQINTVGDLLQYTPAKLLKLKNFGRKSGDEIYTKLKDKYAIIFE